MISYQESIVSKLMEAGIPGTRRALIARLNLLATLGARLRKRYETECSYEWACNSLEFAKVTERLENRIKAIAAEGGLCLYLQGDCRGATVYVDAQPIPDNNYNRSHCLTIESASERRRRLAFKRKQQESGE